jgi:hypothetical protein
MLDNQKQLVQFSSGKFYQIFQGGLMGYYLIMSVKSNARSENYYLINMM